MKTTNGVHTCVFGLGWGDEGKGKIVDLLCPGFDIVVRYNGGANAGHTVCVGSETFALHLLPTGALHADVISVIGPGVALDPVQLVQEIDHLSQRGIDVLSRLKLSDRAHLVLAYHKLEDHLSERAAAASGRIGTTARGIGPCYADKMKRSTAVRVADLVYDSDIDDRIRKLVGARKALFQSLYGDDGGLDADAVVADLSAARQRLSATVCDTTVFLHEAMAAGQTILFEGANGILLDVDHGTYPFVTSSSTGPHGIGAGAGVPSGRLGRIIGTIKCYATRVGSGPFVSELKDKTGDRIREQGREFGTTTGRPRRCGWFDAVASRHAAAIAGVTDLALLHLDTLRGFNEIGICTGYRLAGRSISAPPALAQDLERTEPILEMVPGWDEDVQSIRRFEDLPEATRRYIDRIESLVGVAVSIAGVGPDRSQILVRGPLADVIRIPEPTTL
ncbi:MAG: adenylosuccinate synthase [Planctomycetes bacterium]|nr:adenylosuccinate synthase [Planctomycetota bacterium]